MLYFIDMDEPQIRRQHITNNYRHLATYIPTETYNKIKTQSLETKTSMSKITARIIENYYQNRPTKTLEITYDPYKKNIVPIDIKHIGTDHDGQ